MNGNSVRIVLLGMTFWFGAVAAVSVNDRTKTAELADPKAFKGYLSQGERLRSSEELSHINKLIHSPQTAPRLRSRRRSVMAVR